MDQILKNAYTNIPVCISDALKELYIVQKKLQDECKNVSSQSKNLIGFYEKDITILRNEINQNQMNFNLYCQNTTDKIESLKNNIQNEVYINNIKNEEWRQSTEKKLFEDTLGWKDGANHLKNIVDKAQSVTKEFNDYKERIDKQKLDASQFKQLLLENCKSSTDVIKELNKQLKIQDINLEAQKLRKDVQELQTQDQQKIKEIQKIEVNVNSQVSKSLIQIQEVASNLKQYIKDNDNYVSNYYKLIFDVNSDQRKICDQIDQVKKFVQFVALEELQKELNDSNISQQAVYFDRNKNIKKNQEMIKALEDKISEILSQIQTIKEKNYNENPKNQIDFLRLQIEQQQIIFFDQIKNEIKQTLQQHSQNIQETYFIPLMNQKVQTQKKSKKQSEDEQLTTIDQKNIKVNKTERSDSDQEVGNIKKQSKKKDNLFRSIRSLDRSKEEGIQDQSKQNFIKNNLLNIASVQSIGQGDDKIQTTLSIEPYLEGIKLNKRMNSKNTSHASSRREIIHQDLNDFTEIFKENNVSPDISPLKAKYSNNQQFQSKGNQSKNDLSKNYKTVTSFKKKLSTDLQNLSQTQQDIQDTNQYNITFQTEEDNMLNQINSNNNQNHLNYSKLKTLMSSLAVKNTPNNNSGLGNSILNNTLPDLSFDYISQSADKKQVDNQANFRKLQNKNLINTCYTVIQNQKQNKMSVLNLSLDHINPQKQSSQITKGQQNVNPSGTSFSYQLINSSQIPVLSLNQYGNQASIMRAQKYQLTNNNSQRPISQYSHRNSLCGIGNNNKSANKISSRPKTSHDNHEIHQSKK